MIALFLLLSAPTAPATSPPPQRLCRQLSGEPVPCASQPQQGLYRLPKLSRRTYGPLPGAQSNLGPGVKIRGQATNRGPARRNRSMATVGIPF
jgi:hypothetical protein